MSSSVQTKNPGLLTSLTYQSVTAPGKGGQTLEYQAITLWSKHLIEENLAYTHEESLAWQNDMKERNLNITKIGWQYTGKKQGMKFPSREMHCRF